MINNAGIAFTHDSVRVYMFLTGMIWLFEYVRSLRPGILISTGN